MSSKKQVKEKGKGRWSPVKGSTQSREPPPLPPLVSDRCSQLEREREEGEPRAHMAAWGLLLVSSQPQHHLSIIQASDKKALTPVHAGVAV